MTTNTSRSICPRAGALAAIAVLVFAVGIAHAGNKPTFPANKLPTMTSTGAYTVPWWPAGAGDKLVLLGDSTRFVRQNANTWMRMNNIWHMADPTVEQGWQASWAWPGGKTTRPRITNEQERFGSVSRKQGYMMATKNWPGVSAADQERLTGFATTNIFSPYPHLVHHGFRGNGGWGTLSVRESVQINRYLPQQIIVNGVVLHDQTDPYGPDPLTPATGTGAVEFGRVRGVVDEALPAHRAVYTHQRWQMGVDVQQSIMGYAVNNGIDSDYLLYDHIITNTGVVGQRPGSVVKGHEAALDPFIFSFNWHVRPSDPDMVLGYSNDDVVEFFEPWPTYTNGSGVSHQAVMFYDGDGKGKGDWGGPNYSFNPNPLYTMGYDLWASQYTGIAWIFAETAPGSGEDEPAAPQGTNWCRERDFNLSAFNSDMTKQYRTIFASGQRAKQDQGTDDVLRRRLNGVYDGTDPAVNKDKSVGVTDPTPYMGFNWNSFPYQSSGRAVLAVAAGGINAERARELGKVISRRRDANAPAWETPEEIAEIKTGRDSVKKVLDRAFWNIYGYDPNGARWQTKPAAYNQAFNVPDPPAPPPVVWMSSSEGMNTIEWLPITDAQKKDPDTGVQDFAGYRVYRATGLPDSDYVMVYEGTNTRYEDVDRPGNRVSKDFMYFYYVVSYDDGVQNFSNPNVPLESGKFWLWNGWYDKGVRPSTRRAKTSAELGNIRVVPNPYNVRLQFPTGSMSTEIVWKGLPNKATIRIYTAAGDFVKELIHETAESGSEPWDLRTDNNQYIATGVYIYTVESRDPTVPGTHVGKFIVIR